MKPADRKAMPQQEGSSLQGSPIAWARDVGLGLEIARAARERARRRTRSYRAVGAAACGLVVAVLVWQRIDPFSAMDAAVLASSSTVTMPERRTLSDGSVVTLDRGAEIAVEFSRASRRVVLGRGKAHFDVAKDPAKPFVVSALGVDVRAVGTSFAVERDAAAVDVLVTEGQVAVERPELLAATAAAPAVKAKVDTPSALLSAGNRTTVALADPTAALQAIPVSSDEISRRLSWRVPRIEFEAAPLGDVVRLFAEHGRVELVLADAALRDVKVSGVLRADNVEALLLLLASDHGIDAELRGRKLVLHRRR